MPRPSAADQLKEAEGWLNSKGFPLEMRVAKTFSDNGFLNVYQGEYYADPITGTPRECDLHAVDVFDSGWAGIPLFVHHVVECTYSDKPWIVFPISPTSALLRGQPLPPTLSDSGKHLHEAALALSAETGALTPRLYALPSPIGYAIRTQDKWMDGKRDAAFRKSAELLSATEAILREANQLRRWEWFVPLIVLDGELFSAELDPSGRIKVSATTGGATVLSGIASIPIRIVSESFLPGFCQEQRNSIEDLKARAKPLVERAVKIGNEE